MLSVRRPCASERSLVSVCLSIPCFLQGLSGGVRPTHPCNARSCYRRDIFCFIHSSSTPIAIYHSFYVPTNENQVTIRVGRTLCCKICVCLLWSTQIRMYIYTPLPWPVVTVVDCLPRTWPLDADTFEAGSVLDALDLCGRRASKEGDKASQIIRITDSLWPWRCAPL